MSNDLENVFIYGASGHGKVVIDTVEREGRYKIVFLVDDDLTLKGQEFFGYTIIGDKDDLLAFPSSPASGIVAIGSNVARHKVSSWLAENGFSRVCAIHPSAQISRGTEIGAGTIVMAGACINADTMIGEDVIVNTRASIDHDCKIGDYVHIAPGATLCGTVSVGNNSFVCAGSTVTPNLTIGSHVTIGAGAVVIKDIPDELTVAGIPATELNKGSK